MSKKDSESKVREEFFEKKEKNWGLKTSCMLWINPRVKIVL